MRFSTHLTGLVGCVLPVLCFLGLFLQEQFLDVGLGRIGAQRSVSSSPFGHAGNVHVEDVLKVFQDQQSGFVGIGEMRDNYIPLRQFFQRRFAHTDNSPAIAAKVLCFVAVPIGLFCVEIGSVKLKSQIQLRGTNVYIPQSFRCLDLMEIVINGDVVPELERKSYFLP